MDISPVILAGGTGTRLWPMSRELMPKQFLQIIGEYTLFQETMLRALALNDQFLPVVVCNDNHYFYSADQLNQIHVNDVHYLLEPVARSTAGANALAAIYLQSIGRGEIPMLLMPSDHLLKDVEHLKARVQQAIPFAKAGRIVSFGLCPTKPETGYGYVEMGQPLAEHVNEVLQFIEKPNIETAERYVSAGTFLWNSGILMVTPNAYLKVLRQYQPDVLEQASIAFERGHVGKDYHRIDRAAYESCPNISFEYAVLEKTDQVVVATLDTPWSDLGCWASVSENHRHDLHHNVLIGDVIAEKSHDCFFNAQDNRLIAAIGLENVMVISTADALLIADKRYAQEVKTLVQSLKAANHTSAKTHQRVQHIWGYFDSLALNEAFQVKHIMIKPQGSLPMQSHPHCTHHWVVVSGVAEVVNGDDKITLHINQSTMVPRGVSHALFNHGDEPLHIIEVQSGQCSADGITADTAGHTALSSSLL